MNAHKQAIMELRKIRTELQAGKIAYEEAKRQSEPHLEKINERGKEIAKKHGMRYRPVAFSAFMR